MVFIKRFFGVIVGFFSLIALLFVLVSIFESKEYILGLIFFIIFSLLLNLTFYLFDRKLLPSGKFQKRETTNTLTNDQISVFLNMAKTILEDDKVSQVEAKMLLVYMSSIDEMISDIRTRKLFYTLTEALDDDVLDENEAEEIKTLLSEFCDSPEKSEEPLVKPKRTKQTKKVKNVVKDYSPRINIASSQYAFNYMDANGNFSDREIIFRGVKIQNGKAYLNGICRERNAHRTFRADRIMSLIDLDTGEMFDDADKYVQSLG